MDEQKSERSASADRTLFYSSYNKCDPGPCFTYISVPVNFSIETIGSPVALLLGLKGDRRFD